MSIKYDPDYSVIDFQIIDYIASISKQYNICNCKYLPQKFEISSKTNVSQELIRELENLINGNFKSFANIIFNIVYTDTITTVTFEYMIRKDFELLYLKDRLPPFLREKCVALVKNNMFYSSLFYNHEKFEEAASLLHMLLNTKELSITNNEEKIIITNNVSYNTEIYYYIEDLLLFLDFKFIENIVFTKK